MIIRLSLPLHPSPPPTRDAVILNEADEGGEMKNLPQFNAWILRRGLAACSRFGEMKNLPQFNAGILRRGLAALFARRNEESPAFNAGILRRGLAACSRFGEMKNLPQFSTISDSCV
jgi:hypothetical protein